MIRYVRKEDGEACYGSFDSTMKKVILFLFVIMVGLSVQAQEKLFDEAIRRGTTANGYYCAENTDKKVITEQEMRDYANKKGYYIGRVACIDIQKFGGTKRIVYKFEFAPPENTTNIIFNQLNSSSITYSQLRSRGTAICLRPKNIAGIDDVLWSGTIVDGFINGTGTGFVHKPGEDYVYIQGTFSRGIPSGKVTVKSIAENNISNVGIDWNKTEIRESDAMMASDIGIWSSQLLGDAKAKDAALYRLQKLYPNDYERMKKAYEKALTLSATNYKTFVMDEVSSLGYKDLNYDPKGILPKIKEMEGVKQTLNGLNFEFHNYYGYKSLSLSHQTFNRDKGLIEAYIRAAKKHATDSKYGFKQFHTMAIGKLEKLLSDLTAKAERDQAKYEEEKARQERELAKYSGGGGWSSGGSSSSGTSSSGSSSDDSSSSQDIENISIPSYEYTTEWQTEGLRNKVSNKYGENQVREIKFSDGIETKIARVAGENGYWVYNGSGGRRYRTLEDAIAAAYVYEKYDKVRQKGRW